MPVMITNGGPHSAEDWAMATAKMVFDINPEMAGGRALEAQRLLIKIAESLIVHYQEVMDGEKEYLATNPEGRMATPDEEFQAEAMGEAGEVITDIQTAAAGTPWEAHWQDEEILKVAKYVIASHFLTARDVERKWYNDTNPA